MVNTKVLTSSIIVAIYSTVTIVSGLECRSHLDEVYRNNLPLTKKCFSSVKYCISVYFTDEGGDFGKDAIKFQDCDDLRRFRCKVKDTLVDGGNEICEYIFSREICETEGKDICEWGVPDDPEEYEGDKGICSGFGQQSYQHPNFCCTMGDKTVTIICNPESNVEAPREEKILVTDCNNKCEFKKIPLEHQPDSPKWEIDRIHLLESRMMRFLDYGVPDPDRFEFEDFLGKEEEDDKDDDVEDDEDDDDLPPKGTHAYNILNHGMWGPLPIPLSDYDF